LKIKLVLVLVVVLVELDQIRLFIPAERNLLYIFYKQLGFFSFLLHYRYQ